MITIWKQELRTTRSQQLDVPHDTEILTVQMQNGVPCIWFKVDTKSFNLSRTIKIVPTGCDASKVGTYIGTYQFEEDNLVYHVFEEENNYDNK